MAAGVLLIAGVDAARAIGPRDARTGEECRAQVNANFDAIEAQMRANGNYRGIAVTEDEDRGPALLACEGFEQHLQYERISAALRRLSSATDTLRAGHALTAATIRQLADDRAGIERMSPQPYRHEYLLQYADYRRYLSLAPPTGAETVPTAAGSTTAIHRCGTVEHPIFSDQPCAAGATPRAFALRAAAPAESCEGLRKHLADSKHAYDVAAAALVAGAREAGNGWRSSEAQRRQALSDLRWYGDRARLQGCNPQ
jgi:hypothetical protein